MLCESCEMKVAFTKQNITPPKLQVKIMQKPPKCGRWRNSNSGKELCISALLSTGHRSVLVLVTYSSQIFGMCLTCLW